MNKKIAFMVFLVIIVVGVYAKAGPGSSGAAFLRIGVGAKPVAMGEAYAGMKGDILSLYSNPAGLSSIEYRELSFSHAFWIDSINYSNFIAGTPALEGYMAVSLSGLFAGEMDKFSRFGDDMGETYSPADMAVMTSYSRKFGDVSAGAAIKYITSRIDDHTASAFAADIGAMKELGDVNLGMSVQNIGTEMEFREESDPLPLTVRLGASYPFEFSGMDFIAVAETSYSEDVPFRVNGGVNADIEIDEILLSLRLGGKSYAEGLDFLSHLTTGIGLEYRDINFDYGFASMEDLGLTHRVSVSYKLN